MKIIIIGLILFVFVFVGDCYGAQDTLYPASILVIPSEEDQKKEEKAKRPSEMEKLTQLKEKVEENYPFSHIQVYKVRGGWLLPLWMDIFKVEEMLGELENAMKGIDPGRRNESPRLRCKGYEGRLLLVVTPLVATPFAETKKYVIMDSDQNFVEVEIVYPFSRRNLGERKPDFRLEEEDGKRVLRKNKEKKE